MMGMDTHTDFPDLPLPQKADGAPERLRRWRAQWGLSQSQLAALLRVHTSSISRWENGRRRIPYHLWIALRGLTEEEILEARGDGLPLPVPSEPLAEEDEEADVVVEQPSEAEGDDPVEMGADGSIF